MSGVDFSDPVVIASLTAALEAAGVEGIEIEQGAQKLRIVVERGTSRADVQVETSQHSVASTPLCTVTAPMAGIFASNHPASGALPIALPRAVAAGEIIGFIRVGSVLLSVRAPARGLLTQCFGREDTLVGYGDPLFEIEPSP